MNRTEEFRRLSIQYAPGNTKKDLDVLPPVMEMAARQRKALSECYSALASISSGGYLEIEKAAKEAQAQEEILSQLLTEYTTEETEEFIEGILHSLKLSLRKVQSRLESQRHKKRRGVLNIALEPEKAPATKKTQKLLQILHEENERILESVQYSERELASIQRQISEIDTLQRLITQEIFSQDERIDIVLSKAASATVNVKISKNYLRNAAERRKASRRFLSVLIFVLSIIILLLHLIK